LDLTDPIRRVTFLAYLLHLPYLLSSPFFISLHSPLPARLSLLPLPFALPSFSVCLFLPLLCLVPSPHLSPLPVVQGWVRGRETVLWTLVSGLEQSGRCSVSTRGSNESVIHGTGGTLGTGLDVLCLSAPLGPQIFYLQSGKTSARLAALLELHVVPQLINMVWSFNESVVSFFI
jgi:hypothetical protein